MCFRCLQVVVEFTAENVVTSQISERCRFTPSQKFKVKKEGGWNITDDSLLPDFCCHLLGGLEKYSSQEKHTCSSIVPEGLFLSEMRIN